MRAVILVAVLAVMLPVEVHAQETISTSGIWYASVVRTRFPQGFPIHGVTYRLNELPVLPRDITHFQVSVATTQVAGTRALRVVGSLGVDSVPAPFEVIDGAQGRRYMLHLHAYLFSPTGRLVWQQQGFPAGSAWVQAAGGSVQFTLIDAYAGSLSGHELLVVAAGDPIFSSSSETRVLLGAIRRVFE